MFRGLYLSQQKCVTSVPVGMSVGIYGSCIAVRERRRFRLCGRTSDEQRALHHLPPLSSDYVVAVRNIAYTCLFSKDFNRTDICSCRSHCYIFIETWRRGFAAFVISDEIHYADFVTTSDNLCHSQEGCNFITFPRNRRLMFILRSTCILVFRS